MRKLIYTFLISLLLMGSASGFEIERAQYDTYDINQTINATKTSIFTFHEDNINEDDATWTMTTTGPLVHVTGNTTAATLTTTEAIVAGTTYRVTITGTGGTATASYTLGGVTGTTIAASGAIAIEDYITAATTGALIITPSNTCTVSITSITIQKLTDATGDLTVDGNLTVRSGSTFYSPIITAKGDATYPALTIGTYDDGFYKQSGAEIGLSINSFANHVWGGGTYYIKSDAATIWFGAGNDTAFGRIAANSLAMRNSTNAQTFSLYETYTDGSNYEYYSLGAGSDLLTFTANTLGTGSDNMGFNFTTAGTGVMSHTMADAASVASTRSTKTFLHTRSLAADANDACGGTDDCLTLPIPTTMGYVEIWTSGSLYLSAICLNAGTCTVITDSDAAGTDIEYNAAIGGCAGLCLHNGGTNSIIFNDTAGALTVTVRMVYD